MVGQRNDLFFQQLNSAFLPVTLNFELEELDISNRHFQSDFAQTFDFQCPLICESYQFVVQDFSLVSAII